MNHAPRNIRMGVLKSILSAGVLLGMPLGALADTIWISSGGGGSLEYKNARVMNVKGDAITYEINGRENQKPVSTVAKLHAENEPAFNAAEDAFVAQEWDKAAANYEKAMKASTKEWVKTWSQRRNLEAANKAGRFDLSVKEFVRLAKSKPDSAKTAMPPLPAANSTYLKDAAKALQEGIAGTTNDASREVMFDLLRKVATHMGDTKLAEESAKSLADIRIKLDPNSEEALRAGVMLVLTGAARDVAAKEYDKAISAIEQSAGRIIDPADQVEALWYLAEARAGKAAGSADATAWKDVAVVYMRVVAFAPASSPRVPQALLKTAALHAGPLADKPAAAKLYKSIVQDYKSQEAGKEAQKELEKLEKAG